MRSVHDHETNFYLQGNEKIMQHFEKILKEYLPLFIEIVCHAYKIY